MPHADGDRPLLCVRCLRLDGTDSIAAFHAMHNRDMLDDFDKVHVRIFMF